MGPRSRELLSRLTARRPRHDASRSAPAGRSTSATPRSAPPGSPTSASSAGSCTCPTEFAVGVLRGPAVGGRGPRRRQRRLLRDRVAAAGEGLPRLRPRADSRLHAGRGRPAVRLQAAHRHRLPRSRRRRASARPPGPRRKLVSFSVDDPDVDDVGRRAGAPRRPAGRPGHLGGLGRDRRSCVGLAYLWDPGGGPVDADWVRAASYQVNVGGDRAADHRVAAAARRPRREIGSRPDPSGGGSSVGRRIWKCSPSTSSPTSRTTARALYQLLQWLPALELLADSHDGRHRDP